MNTMGPVRQWRDLGARFLHSLIEMPIHRLLGRQHPTRYSPGASPGTLFIAPDAAATTLRLVRILPEGIEQIEQPDASAIEAARQSGGRLWLDIAGFADDALLQELGRAFDLHPMTLADLVNVNRRTTVEMIGDRGLIITQVLQLDTEDQPPDIVQLGLVMMGDVLLSFRERPGPLFQPLLERLERPVSRLRTEALDYLAQAVLDVAVDAAFPVVEALADRIDEIEDRIMAGEGHGLMIEIHGQRRALITLSRLLWRQRDLMGRLLRDEALFRRETQIYLRDVYDRAVQLLDLIETTRELVASLVEMQLSISAHRSNQIMKTLTIMASIFIPLTFVAGVYGMNFERMPELGWAWGYPAILLLMLTVAVGLLLWFRRRGWLGDEV